MFFPFLFLMATVNFEDKIAPVLIEHCVPCHSSIKVSGGVRLTTNVSVSRVVTPGEPEKSRLYTSIESGAMPPSGTKLTKDQREAIRDWIKEGAKWPPGIVLEGMRLPTDERAFVNRLHDKIAANKAPAAGNMVLIPEGDFVMGSTRHKDEEPEHKIHIDAFWMDKYETIWDTYRQFMFAKDEGVDAVSRPTRPYVEM